jgi:uncharacterized protein (DUF849 family)
MGKENKAVITAALAGKTLARGNWELVERAVQIARLADREPATPAETREIFHLPQR